MSIQHEVGVVELQSVLGLVVLTERLVLFDRETFGLVRVIQLVFAGY